jgi:BirA family biotin operon repressor/biotin-[acetyl-CoA-carboxylase] ligase
VHVDRCQELVRTEYIGRRIIFGQAMTSTNDLARQLADLGAVDGTVVVAETQTSGRGRLNREWVSPLGGLWFSTILRPKLKPSEASKLTFVGGLAVAKTLSKLYDLDVSTKWPNDVLTNGKKVCGMLAEMNSSGEKTNHVVLGIGVNVNFEVNVLPKELWENTTSLRTELGRNVNLERLLRTLLEKLEYTYEVFIRKGFDSVLEEWKTFARLLGSQVEVTDSGKKWVGLASDVDIDGHLILKLQDRTEMRVFAGDVSVRTR